MSFETLVIDALVPRACPCFPRSRWVGAEERGVPAPDLLQLEPVVFVRSFGDQGVSQCLVLRLQAEQGIHARAPIEHGLGGRVWCC